MAKYQVKIQYKGENYSEIVTAQKITIENNKVYITETNDNEFWIDFDELAGIEELK